MLNDWVSHDSPLVAFFIGHVPMVPASAIGFLVLSLGLVGLSQQKQTLVLFSGLFVLLMSLSNFIQGAMELIHPLQVGPWRLPNLFHLPVGDAFTFSLAAALLLLHGRNGTTDHPYYNLLLLLFLVLPLLGIFAHVFAQEEIQRTPVLRESALHTCFAFLAFLFSLILMTHNRGASGLLTRHSRYARNFRLLLFLVLVLPLTVGSIVKYTIELGWMGTGIGIAIFCLFSTLIITTTLAYHTLLIDHWVTQLLDEKRKSIILRNQLHELLEIAPDGILLFDDDLAILHANSGAERILGYSCDQLKNLYLEQLVPPHQRNTSYMSIDRYIHDESSHDSLNLPNRLSLLHKSGQELPVSVSLTKKKRGNQTLLIAIIKNMSHYNDKLRDLEKKAFTDSLTQTLNRAAFQSFAERVTVYELRSSDRSFCVLLMDIDNFKSINDRYGHDTGDKVLQHFSKVVKSVLRHGDRLFRTGGEEFVIITANVDEYSARQFAERIRQAVQNRPVKHGISQIRITCSIGVCVMDSDKRDIPQAVKRADEAMYRAKHSGKNRVRLSNSLKRQSPQKTC